MEISEIEKERRRKISLSLIGNKRCAGNKNHLGHKHSKEIREKISKAIAGKMNKPKSAKWIEAMKKRKGIIAYWLKGKPLSEKQKQNIANSHKKEKAYNYIHDRSKLKRYLGCEERRSPAYQAWRKEVCDRDNWKCRISNDACEGRLEVHHIESFEKFPELKYDINNGICLCKKHHPRKRIYENMLTNYFKKLVADTAITN